VHIGTLAVIILGVALTTAVLVWASLNVCRDVERMERDPRYLRRRFLMLGLLYVGSSVFGIVEVVRGNQPPLSLIGLPIAAALAWLFIRQAANVKVPPR
jgi:hypothetical protein